MTSERKDNFLLLLIIGAAAGLLIKLFAVDILRISGKSMEPSISDGSFAFVNKLAYGIAVPFKGEFLIQWSEPQKGDAIIYLHNDKIVVKRCAAVAGEHLDFLSEQEYSLAVNGNKIPLTESQYEGLKPFSIVHAGYVLALGDNLSQSIDSRDYGFISVKNITGKIIGK